MVNDQSTVTTTPPPPVFQFPIPPPVTDLPTDELKMLLPSRLLEESSFPTRDGMDLISLLRQQTAPSTDAETLALRASLAERDAQLAARDEQIRLLQARVLSL